MTQRWDATQRTALVQALQAAEPEQPTLCQGWEARHLLAHLYVRRHEPWRALPQGEGSALDRLAEQARDAEVYADLVSRFAAAPTPLTPMALADGPLGMAFNFVEYVIHTEDVRRGAGRVEPLPQPQGLADALFDSLAPFALLGLRSMPVGVVLVIPGGRRKVVRRGPQAVAVVGSAVELALVVSGRRRAANVDLLGSDEAIVAFEANC